MKDVSEMISPCGIRVGDCTNLDFQRFDLWLDFVGQVETPESLLAHLAGDDFVMPPQGDATPGVVNMFLGWFGSDWAAPTRERGAQTNLSQQDIDKIKSWHATLANERRKQGVRNVADAFASGGSPELARVFGSKSALDRPVLTEKDFHDIAKNSPEMMRAYYKAVNATIEVKKEVAKNKSGLWATLRLRKKQYDATFLMFQFASGFVFNGRSISDEEKKLVHGWIISAADFHMLSKEDQALVLENAAQQAGL